MKKITLNRQTCIGCGTCAMVCPSHFKMRDDGRSGIVDAEEGEEKEEKEVEEAGCAEDASQSCPAQCIAIEDKE